MQVDRSIGCMSGMTPRRRRNFVEFNSEQLKRDECVRDAIGEGGGRLHMRLALLDRHTPRVGSFNLGPRSAGTSTEMARRVRSEDLSRQLLEALETVRRDGLFELRQAADGQTQQCVDAQAYVVPPGPGEPGMDGLQPLRLERLLGLAPEELLWRVSGDAQPSSSCSLCPARSSR